MGDEYVSYYYDNNDYSNIYSEVLKYHTRDLESTMINRFNTSCLSLRHFRSITTDDLRNFVYFIRNHGDKNMVYRNGTAYYLGTEQYAIDPTKISILDSVNRLPVVVSVYMEMLESGFFS